VIFLDSLFRRGVKIDLCDDKGIDLKAGGQQAQIGSVGHNGHPVKAEVWVMGKGEKIELQEILHRHIAKSDPQVRGCEDFSGSGAGRAQLMAQLILAGIRINQSNQLGRIEHAIPIKATESRTELVAKEAFVLQPNNLTPARPLEGPELIGSGRPAILQVGSPDQEADDDQSDEKDTFPLGNTQE
jgi:hypothetical protein